jgi:hypothetical protein
MGQRRSRKIRMGGKTNMDKKSLVKGFLLCNVLGIAAASLVGSYFNSGTDFLQYLLVFFILWTPGRAIAHILIFGLFFLIVRVLVKKIGPKLLFYLSLFLSGIIYLAAVLWIDWDYSKEAFKTFQSYLREGSYYFVFTSVVILILATMGIIKRLRNSAHHYSVERNNAVE